MRSSANGAARKWPEGGGVEAAPLGQAAIQAADRVEREERTDRQRTRPLAPASAP